MNKVSPSFKERFSIRKYRSAEVVSYLKDSRKRMNPVIGKNKTWIKDFKLVTLRYLFTCTMHKKLCGVMLSLLLVIDT